MNNTNKKCKVCGAELILSKNNHYISRGCEVTGIASIAKREEPKLYDTFDCVVCGCQNVLGERNYRYTSDNDVVVDTDTEETVKECFGHKQEVCDVKDCDVKENCETITIMTEEKREELKEQDCFGYYQEYIDKCRKCSEKERCKHNKESLQVKDTGLSKIIIKYLSDDNEEG